MHVKFGEKLENTHTHTLLVSVNQSCLLLELQRGISKGSAFKRFKTGIWIDWIIFQLLVDTLFRRKITIVDNKTTHLKFRKTLIL